MNICQISSLIQKQLKKNKIHELEDEFVVSVSEECKIKHLEALELLNQFTQEISTMILKNEDVELENIIKKYINLNIALDNYDVNYVFEIILNNHLENMILIQEQYAKATAFTLVHYSNSRVSDKLINAQLDILNAKLYNKIRNVITDEFENYEETYKVKSDELFFLVMQLLDRYDDEEIDTKIQKEDITRFNYISDYKKLEKFALKNDYEFKGQNASSHRKYEHKQTKQCVMIPSHEIGYGLSIKIQKQILKGAVA